MNDLDENFQVFAASSPTTPGFLSRVRSLNVPVWAVAILDRTKAYLALTEPNIQLLGVVTGAAALVLEGSLLRSPLRFLGILILLAMAGGSVKAFNQILERKTDAIMRRTREKRPLPTGRISLIEAVIFGSLLGGASLILFWRSYNSLSALMLLVTMLYYVLFYTIYLKPRTALNVVIGGVAGAMGPVICWAAASGRLELMPWLLSAVIFFWSPPHFWSLTLYYRDDYRQVKTPLLPVIVGERKSWNYILIYALVAIAFSLNLGFVGLGPLYALSAVSLGLTFLYVIFQAKAAGTAQAARRVFVSSIIYLSLPCAAIIVDRILG